MAQSDPPPGRSQKCLTLTVVGGCKCERLGWLLGEDQLAEVARGEVGRR
jgi:hypothetical protein